MLDQSLETSQTILITGESGVGKSSLLSNWIIRRQQKVSLKDEVILFHFLGSSFERFDFFFSFLPSNIHIYKLNSESEENILRRFISEIKQYLDLEDDLPTEPKKLLSSFLPFLKRLCDEVHFFIYLFFFH